MLNTLMKCWIMVRTVICLLVKLESENLMIIKALGGYNVEMLELTIEGWKMRNDDLIEEQSNWDEVNRNFVSG